METKKSIIVFTTRNLSKVEGGNKNIFNDPNPIESTPNLEKHYLNYPNENKYSQYIKSLNNFIDLKVKKNRIQTDFRDILNVTLIDYLANHVKNEKDLKRFIEEEIKIKASEAKILKYSLQDAIEKLTENNRLKNRDRIFKVKNQPIYGYECFEDDGDDFLNNNGRENFITALVKDVAYSEGIDLSNDHYELFLFLHGYDIGFKNSEDIIDVDNDKLLSRGFNTGLDSFKSSITTYVFSHRENSFINNIIKGQKEQYKFQNTSDLIERIKANLQFKKKFIDDEIAFFYQSNEENFNKLKKNLKDNFSNLKIF